MQHVVERLEELGTQETALKADLAHLREHQSRKESLINEKALELTILSAVKAEVETFKRYLVKEGYEEAPAEAAPVAAEPVPEPPQAPEPAAEPPEAPAEESEPKNLPQQD